MQLDNPPAFPGNATINRSTGELMPHQFGNDEFATLGMTLRDYMAAKALAGMLAKEGWPVGMETAQSAYIMADCMLRARGQS